VHPALSWIISLVRNVGKKTHADDVPASALGGYEIEDNGVILVPLKMRNIFWFIPLLKYSSLGLSDRLPKCARPKVVDAL
jgi:hypothetical protein